ncbi:MAG: DUF3857 domain-containing protein [bacterium]|nr:DUF3857 domain-containing protein [bacterium]
MKNKTLLFLSIIFTFLLINSLNADIVYLLKGDEYEGEIQQIKQDTLWVKTNKKIEKFAIDSIVRIEFEEIHSAYKVTDLKDALVDSLWKKGADSKTYPNALNVTLYEKISFQINKDSSWTETHRKIEKVLQPGGRDVSNKILQYLKNSDKLDVTVARTIQPDGRIEWLKQNAKKDESVFSAFPMYDNLNRIRMALAEAKIGGIIETNYEYTYPKASLVHPLLIEEYFRAYEPIEYKEVEIICPKNISLEMYCDKGITTATTSDKDNNVYRFSAYKTKEIKFEYLLPTFPDMSPRVMVALKSDWTQISSQYYKLLSEKLICGEELTNKALELKTPQNIYTFIAKEIKAIPITALNQYSWLPNSPDSIFKYKAGSLPDRILLLYIMLRKAGFENAQLVLTSELGTGKRNTSIHSIAQFPELIVRLDNQWLLPSNERIAFGELPNEYQNRTGLVLSSTQTDIVVEIPAFEPEKEATEKNMLIKLEANGNMNVKEIIKLSGNAAQNFRGNKSLKPDELKKAFEAKVSRVSPGAKLLNYKTSNLENISEPVWYELNYTLPEYALNAGNNLIFKLPGITYSAEIVGKPNRENDMSFGQRVLEANQIEIEYPSTYSVYYMPQNYSYSGVASYEAKFTNNGNKLIFSDKYWLSAPEAPQSKYPEFKKCIETKTKLAQEWIALRKK